MLSGAWLPVTLQWDVSFPLLFFQSFVLSSQPDLSLGSILHIVQLKVFLH